MFAGFKQYFNEIIVQYIFTITKTQKQHKCPSINEWIKKLCYIHTMEY